jgi:ActR/RegA family two-component response regulator
MTLLLVEDDPPTVRSLQRAFEAEGLNVTSVRSCREARAANGPFDCGVFDVELGDGCGVTLAGELLGAGVVARIVFHTANPRCDAALRGSALGGVFSKTGSHQALLDHVLHLIKSTRS